MGSARAGGRVQGELQRPQGASDCGSLALTFSKFSVEDSLGRPMPAAAFTTLQSIGTRNGLLVGYLVLAHPEEGWHGREASVQVERSHLYWCGYPALPH